MGTVDNILKRIVNETNYQSKNDVLSSNDGTIITRYNNYTYGDVNYVNKNLSFEDYVLSQKAFGKRDARIAYNGDNECIYSINTELKIQDPSLNNNQGQSR